MKKCFTLTRVLFFLLFMLAGTTLQAQTIYYVTQNGAGNQSGSSWANAAPGSQLQTTINNAASGSQVWVAAGTYQPASGQSFSMKEGVKIYGSFPASGSPSFTNRSFSQYVTTLLGNGNCVMKNENNGLSQAAILDGFTVKGGDNNDLVAGAGIRNVNVSPQLNNLVITGNHAGVHYGGVYNSGGSPSFTNVAIINNRAEYQGGGMGNENSSPTLTNVAFIGNYGGSYGGAMSNSGSSLITLINVTIANNTTGAWTSGAVETYLDANMNIANCIIYGNNTTGITTNYGNANVTVRYSLVQGSGKDDTNHNLDGNTDPLFVDAANGNVRLKPNSPVLNLGDNSANSTATDLDGNTRKYGVIDLGAYEYQGQPCTPASISQQPQNDTVCEGGKVTFTIAATGTNLIYKWHKDGQSISNNSPTLTISNVQVSGAGKYTVDVISDCGTVTSDAATLTVNSAPSITSQPVDATVCEGSAASFSIAVAGTPAPAIQWQLSRDAGVSWINIGNNSSSVSISNTTASMSGNYKFRATISNDCSTISSNIATLIVNSASTPAVTVVNGCGNSTLSTTAAGSLLWSTGETTPSITVSSAGTYTVKQTVNGCISKAGSGSASPKAIPVMPVVTVADNCGSSTLSTNATGSLLWSTKETTPSITVNTAGTYTITQTIDGCMSTVGSGSAAPKVVPPEPLVNVANDCGSTTLSTTAAGSLLWSNGANTPSITTMESGSYTVTTTNASGCTSVASNAATVTVKAVPGKPAVKANGATSFCAGGSVMLTAPEGYSSYQWSNGKTTQSITVSETGAYSVTVANESGCTSVASDAVDVTVNALPSVPVVTVSNNCGSSTLSTSATGALLWNTGATTPSIIVNTAGTYTVTQTVDGCKSDKGSVTAAPYTIPVKPVINASGPTTFYTGGSVTLNAPAGYSSYLWSNGATSQSVTVTASGSYSVAVTNSTGCQSVSSDAVTVTVRPLPSVLSVSYMDGDNKQKTNNNIRPYLQLNNDGTSAVAYKDITIRYWLTVEEFAPMTNLAIDWAQLGTNKVKMKYVKLGQPLQGAYGYIEYSFDASAGTLVAGKNSGPIQSRAAKSDWTNFDETDDYSYAPYNNYTKNSKITVYQNGVLVGGTEPTAIPLVQNLKAYSQDRSGATTTNSISNYLKLNNEGNTPVSYNDITIRYWFTADGNKPLNYYLDYAQLGSNNIKYKFVNLASPVSTADTYLELSFTAPDSLYPISSTGNIQQRIAKSDWSNFNELNDHSYQAGKVMSENMHVTVYIKGSLVYGTEPTNTRTLQPFAASRMVTQPQADSKPAAFDKLDVAVLTNPVMGNDVKFMVKGAQGKQVKATLTDVQGRVINKKEFIQSGEATPQQFMIQRNANGILFLSVSTSTEAKTVKVMIGK